MDNMDHDAKPKIDRAERMAQVVAAGGCSRNSLSHMCPLIISDPLQLLAGSSTLCTAGAINDSIGPFHSHYMISGSPGSTHARQHCTAEWFDMAVRIFFALLM
jgi:hypothetical protein